jgi:hypothetical protein
VRTGMARIDGDTANHHLYPAIATCRAWLTFSFMHFAGRGLIGARRNACHVLQEQELKKGAHNRLIHGWRRQAHCLPMVRQPRKACRVSLPPHRNRA